MAVREPVRHRGDRRSCPAVWGQQRDGVRAASRRAEYVPYSVRCRKRVRGAREGRRVAAQWWRGGAQSPWGAGMSLGVKHRRGGRGEQSRKGGGRLETLRLGVRAERRSFAGRRGTGPRREATGGSRGPGPQCGPVGRRFRFRWGRGGGRGAGPRDRSVRGASGRRWDPQNKGRGGSGAGRPQPGRAEAGGGRAGPSETAAGGGRKAAGGLGPGRAEGGGAVGPAAGQGRHGGGRDEDHLPPGRAGDAVPGEAADPGRARHPRRLQGPPQPPQLQVLLQVHGRRLRVSAAPGRALRRAGAQPAPLRPAAWGWDGAPESPPCASPLASRGAVPWSPPGLGGTRLAATAPC